jgi:hypothetical protein
MPNPPVKQTGQTKEPEEESFAQDDLWRQLENAKRLRSAQDQVLWNIFGIFWAANGILLVALFSSEAYPRYVIGTIISGVGFLMSLAWHGIQCRALGHIGRYEALIERIERRLLIPAELAISGRINCEDYHRFLGHGIHARRIMPICSLVAAILWALAFLFFFVKLVCCGIIKSLI